MREEGRERERESEREEGDELIEEEKEGGERIW